MAESIAHDQSIALRRKRGGATVVSQPLDSEKDQPESTGRCGAGRLHPVVDTLAPPTGVALDAVRAKGRFELTFLADPSFPRAT